VRIDMALEFFIFGFLSAVVMVAVIISALYLKSRQNSPRIKGYLDLIPGLSDEQRLKVQNIRRTFLPNVERIRQDLCGYRFELAKALFSEPTDRDRVQFISQIIIKCQSELEREVIEHIIEEKELLNSKQQKRFFEIILEQFAHGGLGVHDVNQQRKP
jgi:hypothetical protein